MEKNNIEKKDDQQEQFSENNPADELNSTPSEPEKPEETPAKPEPESSQEAAESSPPAGEPVTAEEKPKRSFFYKLLSPETRMGRFMRPFLRITATVIGFFALGFLTTYILLYRPTRIAYEDTYNRLNQTTTQLDETQTQLETSQAEYLTLETDSQKEIEGLNEDLDLANTRINFLKFKNNINLARRALVYDDEGATALEALNDAEDDLNDLLPSLEKIDPVLAGLLGNRLSVVKGELVRNPDQATLELESLYNTLLEFEMELFE